MIFFLERAKSYLRRVAIISEGQSFSYESLLSRADAIASTLLHNETNLKEQRIAFMVDPSFAYTAIQWGIWKAGGIAVPLCVQHPLPAIEYVLQDIQCKTIVLEQKYISFLRPLIGQFKLRTIVYEDIRRVKLVELPDVDESRRAMILYTSGTTSLPKGVVTTHLNIRSQISTLVNSWQWTRDDHILNILPLHHVHGIINVMSCALWSGATCEFLSKFSPEAVWNKFSYGRINLFMAVPTIYHKLIRFWEDSDHERQKVLSITCQEFRLMVSGSAALPVSVLEKWKAISGHILLERYGMTEIGMGLSNPYEGERRPGHVGLPLPGVSVRLADEEDIIVEHGSSGEIQIKGPGVFAEYWQKPGATKKAFTEDGWFRTGDVAIISDGYYKILGRTSIDIIKSGGYKVSALEIEEVIRNYPGIQDCAVIGLPDEEWGEIVVAAVVVSSTVFNSDQLEEWLKERLPRYKVPKHYKIIKDLPRNTLGKVTKNDLKKIF